MGSNLDQMQGQPLGQTWSTCGQSKPRTVAKSLTLISHSLLASDNPILLTTSTPDTARAAPPDLPAFAPAEAGRCRCTRTPPEPPAAAGAAAADAGRIQVWLGPWTPAVPPQEASADAFCCRVGPPAPAAAAAPTRGAAAPPLATGAAATASPAPSAAPIASAAVAAHVVAPARCRSPSNSCCTSQALPSADLLHTSGPVAAASAASVSASNGLPSPRNGLRPKPSSIGSFLGSQMEAASAQPAPPLNMYVIWDWKALGMAVGAACACGCCSCWYCCKKAAEEVGVGHCTAAEAGRPAVHERWLWGQMAQGF